MSWELIYTGQEIRTAEPDIAVALARARAAAVAQDRYGQPGVLSARQVAAYHHGVFARYGLPPWVFGATQLTGNLDEAGVLAPLWCPGCDPVP